MAVRERLRNVARRLNDSVQREADSPNSRMASREKSPRMDTRKQSQQRARDRARAILAAAEPGTGAGDVDRRKKSRTQAMFERAERAATASAPIEASIDPTPDATHIWEFSMASPGSGGGPAAGLGGGSFDRVADMARVGGLNLGQPETEPDWGDNPSHLDTPAEVRASLRADGLDPMDTDTREEAMFGHFLVHAYADDEDMGGRTPAQLEAEHDLTVAAMLSYGVGHESPMDRPDGPFAFDDPYGIGGGR